MQVSIDDELSETPGSSGDAAASPGTIQQNRGEAVRAPPPDISIFPRNGESALSRETLIVGALSGFSRGLTEENEPPQSHSFFGSPFLLKLRQAALDDAVDKVNDLFAAVLFIALDHHVHQPVGQMGVEHFQLGLRGAAQVLFPVGDAFAAGHIDHAAKDIGTGVLKDQHAAGLLLPLDHRIDGLDQRGHVKGIHQLERLLKRFQQILLDALQQRKSVAVVGVKRRPVQLGPFADLLDGDFVDRLFLQKR